MSSPNGSSPHRSPVVIEGPGTYFSNAQAPAGVDTRRVWAALLLRPSRRQRGTGGPLGFGQQSSHSGSRSRRVAKESKHGDSTDSRDVGQCPVSGQSRVRCGQLRDSLSLPVLRANIRRMLVTPSSRAGPKRRHVTHTGPSARV